MTDPVPEAVDAYPLLDDVLVHHAAFLGKTRAGKTSSAKTAVERFVRAGDRVCILDPIKSDWWGVTSSADGSAPGLPFQILGGPRGHMPLPSSAGAVIGELVGNGALPLSIIDMADFEAGGLQKFFIAFAEALFRHHRGILHLVIEEAHEFGPKERAGIGDENMAVHWIKKLATAGGSRGIRLMVATQRTQALHNAVLGSCETLIAHRLTAPADQKPVVDWLKANVQRGLAAEIAGSLSSLPTGTAWVCSGEAQLFERVAFPRITTFDNSATPLTDDAAREVRTAPVDVAGLERLLGAAVAEAQANDPKTLRARIAELEKAGGGPNPQALAAMRLAAIEEGYARGQIAGIALGLTKARNALDALRVHSIADEAGEAEGAEAPPPGKPPAAAPPKPPPPGPTKAPKPTGGATEVLRRALARYPQRGLTWDEACVVAGMITGNGYFYGGRKALLEGGALAARPGERHALAHAAPGTPDRPMTAQEVQATWAKLGRPATLMLTHLIVHGPGWIEAGDMAHALQIKPGNGYWYGGLAKLRKAGLMVQDSGRVALSPFVAEMADG